MDVRRSPEIEEAGRRWAERTCAEQGIALKVTDECVARQIATLLYAGRGEEAGGPRHAGRTRRSSNRLRPRTAGPMVT
jgi:hypothetical protein